MTYRISVLAFRGIYNMASFVPLVESGICLLVDVATLSTKIYATSFCLFRYAYPSSSLTCTSGRLSFAVGERYYWLCVYFLSAISFRIRTYGDSTYVRTYFLSAISFLIRTYGDSIYVQTPTPHPYYDSVPLHKHQIYIRPIFHIWVPQGFEVVEVQDVYTRFQKVTAAEGMLRIINNSSEASF